MIDPIAVGETQEFVLASDKENENPTIWIVGPIDSVEQARIMKTRMKISVEKDGMPKIEKIENENDNEFTIVKFGLKGWKNFGTLEFRTEKEKLYDREVDAVPDDLIRQIPLDIIYKLSDAIWNENHVDDELVKN